MAERQWTEATRQFFNRAPGATAGSGILRIGGSSAGGPIPEAEWSKLSFSQKRAWQWAQQQAKAR